MTRLLEIKDLNYWYTNKEDALYNDVNLTFEAGRLYAILGSSGSGKTTFLSLIAGLDVPKKGDVVYDGKSIRKIGMTQYRNRCVSIVFQSYNLLPYMSALENIVSAMEITHSKQKDRRAYALAMLEKVGITKELALKNVQHLSGGQQQRVAIVRAMCCDAQLVVADEPTGNLDEQNSREIILLFKRLAHEQQKCVIVITHEKDIAKECDTILQLKNKTFQLVK
ncbi:ABC transporter ATP-binding protein [Caldibacillus lycopersici]|uniref:ABC transporter ATP-binding protein n=1 Tax=Perspicuibacillus lycopersici TaxID=1325689 RepID=A0AAE3IQ49_9BACI|nr:ABC transporter ATP-binding protein [Perspicuibacillus lycopersici]MCU9612367.1 ABC transporter ATP-binding protein [Perspicuibacillus lycopersici]